MTNEYEIDQDQQPLATSEDAQVTTNGQQATIPTAPTPAATPTRRRAVTSSLLSQNMLQAQTALLDNEMVTLHDNAEEYRLIRIYMAELEAWHHQHTG